MAFNLTKILIEYRRKKFIDEENRIRQEHPVMDYIDQSFLEGKLSEIEKDRPKIRNGLFVCDTCQVKAVPEVQTWYVDGVPLQYKLCSYCGHDNLDQGFRRIARDKRLAAAGQYSKEFTER